MSCAEGYMTDSEVFLEYIDLSVWAKAWKMLFLSAFLGVSTDFLPRRTIPAMSHIDLPRMDALLALGHDSRLAWLKELHCILGAGEPNALFHQPTQTLFAASRQVVLLLQDMIESGATLAQATAHAGFSDAVSGAIIDRIAGVLESRPLVGQAQPTPRVLKKLVLNVSHDCNMRCLYCFAQGGTYRLERSLMSPKMTRQVIRSMLGYYNEIGELMFFGGEPTLNPPAIHSACEQLQKAYEKGILSALPFCGLVTNGLEMSSTMLSLIERYHLSVTVSLDGPASLTDGLRKALDGRSVMQRITATIHALQSLTDGREPSAVEMVYTDAHRQAGSSMSDLLDYFKQEFGIRHVYISPVILVPEQTLHWTSQGQERAMVQTAAAKVIESWSSSDRLQSKSLTRCLHPLITGQSLPYLCTAGLDHLAVIPDGSIYPCYLLMDNEFKMGSISEAHPFEEERFQLVQKRMMANAKVNLSQCRDCWMNGLCRVCLGAVFSPGEIMSIQASHVPTDLCEFNRATAESVFLTLCRLHTDPQAWESLVSNVIAMLQSNVYRNM